jgi:hypothetical protein
MRKLGEGSTPLRPAVPNPLYEESRMEDTIADTADVRQRIAIQPSRSATMSGRELANERARQLAAKLPGCAVRGKLGGGL